MTITIYIDVMYVEIPATREKCRNLQEIVQEFAGISGICRNIRNLQEFAGIAGPWHPWPIVKIFFECPCLRPLRSAGRMADHPKK